MSVDEQKIRETLYDLEEAATERGLDLGTEELADYKACVEEIWRRVCGGREAPESKEYLRLYRDLECGEHYCQQCGDCLHCYGGENCYYNGADNGPHVWDEEARKAVQ